MVSELVDMLEKLLENLRMEFQHEVVSAKKRVYFHGVNIAAPAVSHETFTPFGQKEIAIWKIVATAPHVKDRMKKWFCDAATLITKAPSIQTSIWETDEVQFPEAAITVFALLNLDFVPEYTRLLTVWDMDHEVGQHDTISAIVRQHGVTTETEALLEIRATTAMGQRGDDQFLDLRPELTAHYGDLAKSKFSHFYR